MGPGDEGGAWGIQEAAEAGTETEETMTEQPPMVTVTDADGRSFQLPVRCESDEEGIEADLVVFGNVVVRQDRRIGSGPLFGVGIPELIEKWRDEFDSSGTEPLPVKP